MITVTIPLTTIPLTTISPALSFVAVVLTCLVLHVACRAAALRPQLRPVRVRRR